MKTDNLEQLKKELERIKNMGYVKSITSGAIGISETFKDLLGKDLNVGDYKGIEIRTKRSYSKSYITLFNATFSGKTDNEVKRLKNTYGYQDKVMKKCKVLNTSVQANTCTFVANRFLFKLEIDYEEEKVYLVIFDKNMQFLERKVYWSFKTLELKFYRKFKILSLIKAWIKIVDGEEYYKYYDVDFYKLKSFKEFLMLLEDGTIRVTFKIGVFRTGKRMGEIHDKGTSFEIEEINLLKLYDIFKI